MHDSFTLAVTGQSLIKHDLGREPEDGFAQVQAILGSADLAFTNFEGTIYGSHRGWPLKGSFFGCSEPFVLDTLKAIGFRALALSNNHAFDLGPPGILSTLEEVEHRGFLHAGIGRDQTLAACAGVKDIAGRRIALIAMDGGPGPDFMYAANAGPSRPGRPGVNRLRLSQVIEVEEQAFDHLRHVRDQVGYTAIDLANDSQPDDAPSLAGGDELALARALFQRSNRFGRNVKIDRADMERNLAAIAGAADDGALVIAYLHHHHWASDWYQVPDWVGGVARQCIDAGAAVFASHGAPVLQPVELYRGCPIFYSLGNFIFHVGSKKSTWTAPEVWESVVATCTFGRHNRIEAITFHPIVIGGAARLHDPVLEHRRAPHLATGAAAARILARFADQCARRGVQVDIAGDVAQIDCRQEAGRVPLPAHANR